MLAGPRRKQKVVNLRGGNSAWSDDSGKFGQRMLERMGWSRGKGLGAREDGVVTHVVARYKNDERGLGYEERSDQWTQHDDQFTKLLADLSGVDNGEPNISTTDGSTPHSGVSLEVKSKKSRVRVHYHKFTRGKDLSRYSEKDLANIFGKKSLRAASEVATPAEDTVDNVHLFKTGGTMDDYFNGKMRALGGNTVSAPISRDQSPEHAFRGFAGVPAYSDAEADDADAPVATFSFYKSKNYSPEGLTLDINKESCDRRNKKNKHKRDEEVDCKKDYESEALLSGDNCVNVDKIQKKKIKKKVTQVEYETEEDKTREMYELSQNVEINVATVRKKKRKNKLKRSEKYKSEEENTYQYNLSQNFVIDVARIKKKKSKKKLIQAEKAETMSRGKYDLSENAEIVAKIKKKKCKKKHFDMDEVEREKTTDEDNATANTSKKSKRRATEDSAVLSEISCDRKKSKKEKNRQHKINL